MSERPRVESGDALSHDVGGGLLSAGSVVVFLSVDLLALVILRILNASLLSGADVTIGARSGLLAIDARLASLQVRGFFVGERAGLDALLYAALLIDIALYVGLHPLRGGRIRVTAHSIVV
jgi:hypothetical protein